MIGYIDSLVRGLCYVYPVTFRGTLCIYSIIVFYNNKQENFLYILKEKFAFTFCIIICILSNLILIKYIFFKYSNPKNIIFYKKVPN